MNIPHKQQQQLQQQQQQQLVIPKEQYITITEQYTKQKNLRKTITTTKQITIPAGAATKATVVTTNQRTLKSQIALKLKEYQNKLTTTAKNHYQERILSDHTKNYTNNKNNNNNTQQQQLQQQKKRGKKEEEKPKLTRKHSELQNIILEEENIIISKKKKKDIKVKIEEKQKNEDEILSPMRLLPMTSGTVFYNENLIEGDEKKKTLNNKKKTNNEKEERTQQQQQQLQQQHSEKQLQIEEEGTKKSTTTMEIKSSVESNATDQSMEEIFMNEETTTKWNSITREWEGTENRREKAQTREQQHQKKMSDKDFKLVSFLLSKISNAYRLPLLIQELCTMGYLQDPRIKNIETIRAASKQFIEDVLKEKVSEIQDAMQERRMLKSAAINIEEKRSKLLFEFLSQNRSRFHKDFENLGILGKGAFGCVYKAKHHLDNQEYAIKRIVFRFSNVKKLKKETDRVLREVRTVAALNHPHIVKYNQAWFEQYRIEDELTKDDVDYSDDEAEEEDRNKQLLFHFDEDISALDKSIEYEDSKYSSDETLSDSDESENEAEETIPIKKTRNSFEFTVEEVSEDNCSATTPPIIGVAASPLPSQGKQIAFEVTRPPVQTNHDPDMQDFLLHHPVMHHVTMDGEMKNGKVIYRQVLYIQMQLCKSYTLEDWLWEPKRCEGQIVNLGLVANFSLQILSAMAHIHKKGLIHRDIKPANIFLDENDSVRLGDFGLAKLNQMTHPHAHSHAHTHTHAHTHSNQSNVSSTFSPSKSSTQSQTSTQSTTQACSIVAPRPDVVMHSIQTDHLLSHTKDVGTPTYASPEQLDNQFYDEKADIFAFGILFFEMLHPFSTRSERAIVLQSLRQGHLSADFIRRFPDASQLILNCVHVNPFVRFTAADLLARVRDIFKSDIANSPVKFMTEDGICYSPIQNQMDDSSTSSSPPSSIQSSSFESLLAQKDSLLAQKDARIDALEAKLRSLQAKLEH